MAESNHCSRLLVSCISYSNVDEYVMIYQLDLDLDYKNGLRKIIDEEVILDAGHHLQSKIQVSELKDDGTIPMYSRSFDDFNIQAWNFETRKFEEPCRLVHNDCFSFYSYTFKIEYIIQLSAILRNIYNRNNINRINKIIILLQPYNNHTRIGMCICANDKIN